MYRIYGKRTQEPFVDKQFRMLTAKGMRTTKSDEAMLFSDKKSAQDMLDKIQSGKIYYGAKFEIRKA